MNVAYNTQNLLTDVNGHYIPQYYDSVTNNYAAVGGENGGSYVIQVGMVPKGHQTVSVLTTATGLGSGIPSGATQAFITVETSSCRYWVDGTAPTGSQGHLVNNGDTIVLNASAQLVNFQIICISSTATLQITYF